MCLGNCQRVISSLQDMYRMYILVISIDFDNLGENVSSFLPFVHIFFRGGHREGPVVSCIEFGQTETNQCRRGKIVKF